jgi:8-oxo-dGTP pyrophosphatase MutT (NUDIX family)
MAQIRKAASIIVCAPFKDQFKILMLQRSDYGFYGGLLVFPGGTLAVADAAPDWNCIASKSSDLDLRICAIRETFEESGLLLAPVKGLSVEDIKDWRAKVIQDPLNFIQFARITLRKPQVELLTPWSRWISPKHHPKIFDTTFYLHLVSPTLMNTVEADGKETVQVSWLTPQEILDKFQRKEITLLPPQFCQVTELATFNLEKLKKVIQDREPEEIAPVMIEQTPTIIKMQLATSGIFSGQLELSHVKSKVFGIRWIRSNAKL